MILKYFEKITWHQRYTKRHNDLDFIPPSTFSVPFNLVVYFSMTVLQKKKFVDGVYSIIKEVRLENLFQKENGRRKQCSLEGIPWHFAKALQGECYNMGA